MSTASIEIRVFNQRCLRWQHPTLNMCHCARQTTVGLSMNSIINSMKHYLKDFAQPVAASAWLAMVGWADSKLCISGGTLARQSGRSFIDI